MHAIGIDIGGTKIAGAVVDEFGAIVRSERVPTPAGDPQAIVEDAVVAMIELARGRRGGRRGRASPPPGSSTPPSRPSTTRPNINWRNEPFARAARAPASASTSRSTTTRTPPAGPSSGSAPAGCVSDMIMLTIGTGVGGAIVAGDRLFRGGFGAGAELGHMRVVPDGLPCGCGQRGCIEQYGSGRALLRMANEIADAGGIGQRARRGARRARRARRPPRRRRSSTPDDPGALAALRELGHWLGQALRVARRRARPAACSSSAAESPSAGELLLDPIREAYLAAPAGARLPPRARVRRSPSS